MLRISQQLEVIGYTDEDCLYENVDSDGVAISSGIDVSGAIYQGGYAIPFLTCTACIDESQYADKNEEYDWDEVRRGRGACERS